MKFNLLWSVSVLTLIIAAQAFMPTRLVSCSCLPPPAPQQALRDVDVVFSGTVVSIDSAGLQKAVLFDVTEVWKGVSGSQVVVHTPNDSAACGIEFGVGTSYLVYARTVDGELSTGLCDRTAELSLATADVQALGPGRPPGDLPGMPTTGQPDAYSYLTLLALTVASASLALGLSLLARRKRA